MIIQDFLCGSNLVLYNFPGSSRMEILVVTFMQEILTSRKFFLIPALLHKGIKNVLCPQTQ